MANMDDDFDWGDDPFDGDLDFDTDFDKPSSKQGFIRSFATGFLSGIVSKTVGDTDARINTLKMVLPKSYTGAFSNLDRFAQVRREVMEDIKAESVGMVQDLQYLAARAAKRIAQSTPNKISEGLVGFSQRDFSGWERTDYSGDQKPTLEGVNEDEVKSALSAEDANSILERETAERVGKETISMMSEVGGRTISGIAATAASVSQGNQLLAQLLQHQRQVKARNDAMQLNILARTYLTNAKFYKFVEASNHRIIDELKSITKYSRMSDYEKTSHSQAMRKSIRESVFSTVKSGFGGIRDFIVDKFGKDGRSNAIMDASGVIGSVRMAAEMTEGMDMNLGNMLGGAAAGIFISNLPKMVKSDRGQEYVNRFKKQFPKLSKWAEDAYLRIEDLGNVASYASGNMEGMVNSLSKHYQGGFSMEEYDTYEDYLESVKPGDRVLKKFEWVALTNLKKGTNKGLSMLLDNVWNGEGSTYTLKQRTLADGYEQSLWSRQSDRTLNEILPQWLSQIHLSLEKFRTGRDDLRAWSYDYAKANFIQHDRKLARTVNTVLDRSQFRSQAESANRLAEDIDSLNALSPEAKRHLAYRLIRDSDANMGFNPYDFVALEDEEEGVSQKAKDEIKRLFQSEFGITEELIQEFKNGTDSDRLLKSLYLPTEKGRKRAAELLESAKGLGAFVPDISNKVDILRSSGDLGALKETNIIKEDAYGRDEINTQLIWDTIKKYIEDPKRRSAEMPEEVAPLAGRNFAPFAGPAQPAVSREVKVEGMEELTKSLSGINDMKGLLSDYLKQNVTPVAGPDILPLTRGVEGIKTQLDTLVELASGRNTLLTQILESQPPRSKTDTRDEEELKKEKKSIIERLKNTSFREMFNKGVDKLLDHEPLVLGGLLGSLAGVAFYNPKAAALLGGGAAAAMAYSKFRSMAMARTASDLEDLYEEGSDVPILEAFKLRRGDYLDMTTNFILRSWEDISGSVRDITNNTIIGARRLAGKLFTQDNKEVFLKGLNKVRDWITRAWKFADPFGRAIDLKDKASKKFYQMDVYKEGEDSPTLLGKSFEGGAYYKRGSDGTMVELKGWNEIDGPVYDRDGQVLITQAEYDQGLKTSMGVRINKLGAASRALGRMGLDFMAKVRERAAPQLTKAKDAVTDVFRADYTPVTNSVDRIYHLLLKHWGYPSDDTPGGAPEGSGPTPQEIERREVEEANPPSMDKFRVSKYLEQDPDDPNDRLNSLKDKADKAREKKSNRVQDAIITIAENFGFGSKNAEEDSKKKRFGLFGMLAGGLGFIKDGLFGLTKFMTGSLFGSLKLLGKFASIGIKALPVIASGIVGLVKGAAGLMKGKEAGDFIADWGDFGPADEEDPKKRKRRKRWFEPKSKRTVGSRIGGGIKTLGTGLLIGGAASALASSGIIDEGGAIDKVADVASTATTLYGGYQVATGVAAAAGVDIGLGALAGYASAGLGAAAPLLFNPITLGALAIGAIGYGIYKFTTRGKGKQVPLRLTQYGLSDPEGDLAQKVLQAEAMLTDFVVIGNGRASIAKNAPIEEVFNLFLSSQKEAGEVFTWFNGRFKPVFLTYMACLDAVGMKSLKEYDDSSSPDVYRVAKQAHQALSRVMPFPYSVVSTVDKDTPILPERATVVRVNNLLEELRAYTERKTSKEDKLAIDTPVGKESLEKEKAVLEAQLKDPDKTWGNSWSSISNQETARKRLELINKELDGFSSKYTVSAAVKEIYIKDLLPPDKAMDLLTAVRVACYGNDQDTAWRVEAVLKLERYCESMFSGSDEDVDFKGQIGEVYKLFKDSFRVDQGDADTWCLWFRDRFIPVMRTYVRMVKQYRRGLPGVTWKTLSVTARFEIAKALVETRVDVAGRVVSIWDVRAAPFKHSISPAKPGKVDRMLKLLGEASTEAKLRDPEAEAGKTSVSRWAKEISPHKTGGGYTPNYANVEDVSKAKTRKDIALGGQFGTNVNRGVGTGNTYNMDGVYMTPSTKYGYAPLNGDSDTSHLDMSGVRTVGKGGDDKGVSVPRKVAEQLIIREMLKQGFTDPRAIAEMLALTNFESAGYTKTVENMNYSNPQRLVSMFKEIRSIEQANQLIKAGEQATANAVYGGAKGMSLGNTEPGDGWKYRGRGFVHLTGKANYDKIGQAIGVDLVNNPELASQDPNVMAAIAVEFFKNSKLLQSISTTNDFGRAATGLNGGNPLPDMDKRFSLYVSYLKQLQEGKLTADENAVNIANASTEMGNPAPMASRQTSSQMYGRSEPMIGGGNTPSMTGYGGGGYYGGGEGGGTESIVRNYSTDNSGLRLKSPEATAGGQAHPGIVRLAQLIQNRVRGFRHFTALNDLYHQKKAGNSKHKRGLALDFTLVNGISGSDAAVYTVQEILGQAGLSSKEYLVLNEYRRLSANGTGGHVHVGFTSDEAANKFAQAAGASEPTGQDTTPGGLLNERSMERAMPVPPPAPTRGTGAGLYEAPAAEEGDEGAATAPAFAPQSSAIPTSQFAPPATAQKAPQEPKQPQPVATPQPQAVASPAPSQDLSGLMDGLTKAMSQSGDQQAVLLKGIFDQLVELNKKGGHAGKSVNLG